MTDCACPKSVLDLKPFLTGEPVARTCATRLLKNARYLQQVARAVGPDEEPAARYASLLPADLLARLHLIELVDQLPAELRPYLTAAALRRVTATARIAGLPK